MKKIKQAAAVGVAGLALALGGVPAAAATAAAPVSSGSDEVAEVSVSTPQEADVSEAAARWRHGKTALSRNHQRCWSHYYHSSKRHYATAQIGVGRVIARARAGKWAKASRTGPLSLDCTTGRGTYRR